ncbi:DUF1189 family protein [Nanoarchaeota archaeon]
MKKDGFLKNLGLSWQPWKYERIHDTHGRSIFKYFLLLVLFGFLICTVLFLPKLYADISFQMDNFKELAVDVNTSMTGPVFLPLNNPLLGIDTRDKPVSSQYSKVLLTDDFFYVKKPLFLGTERIDSTDFKDLTANQGLLSAMILLMLPSLLLLFFLYYLFKTLLILFIVTVIALVICRITKFDIDYSDLWKVGLLAATPMVFIDFLRFPFGLFIFWAQYFIFLLFFIIGVVKAGEFETMRPRKKKRKLR